MGSLVDPRVVREALARQRARRFARGLQDIREEAARAQRATRGEARIKYNTAGEVLYTVDPLTGVPVYNPAVITTAYQPTQPDVNAGPRMLSIEWDGTFEDGTWDTTCYVVHIHLMTTAGNPLTTHNHVGTFISDQGGHHLELSATGTTKYAYLRLENIAGVLGPASTGQSGAAT